MWKLILPISLFGAILSQEFDCQLYPITFISTSLTKSQLKYSIYDKELLAIKVALEEWRHYLEGARHPFTIYTDHKNLTFARKPELLSQQQIRWYELLSRFDFNLVYRFGKKSGKPEFCLEEVIICLTTLVIFLAVLLTINLLMNP